MTPPLPVVASAADVAASDGRRVQVRGTYGVQDLGRYSVMVEGPGGQWTKVHHQAYVTLVDGSFVTLQARPRDEMTSLEGTPVTVTGTLHVPSDPGGPAARPDPVPTLVNIDEVGPG